MWVLIEIRWGINLNMEIKWADVIIEVLLIDSGGGVYWEFNTFEIKFLHESFISGFQCRIEINLNREWFF